MSDSAAIQELKRKIEELKEASQEDGVDLSEEIERLEAKLDALAPSSEDAVTAPDEAEAETNPDWATVKLARHPKRPSTLDYLARIAEDYYELRGDRCFADDRAMITALARIDGRTVVGIGHQKGHSAEENQTRNFGMAHPEGYRKAQRAMRLAERFGFPVLSFIDTPGAYPGIGAEERNIGGALAESIYTLFKIRVPVVATVVGEGGSGGALGIGVGDRVLMMENATYSVISPEGCAAILWRDRERAPDAARALKMTADHLQAFGVIDEIIPEPTGGAHIAPNEAADSLKAVVTRHLAEIEAQPIATLQAVRHAKFQAMGQFQELSEVHDPAEAASGEGEP